MVFFFFNDTATTEIYTLSLHDALPISGRRREKPPSDERRRRRTSYAGRPGRRPRRAATKRSFASRSEEHTSELQSRQYLVCRLLLEKKKVLRFCHSYQIPDAPCIGNCI